MVSKFNPEINKVYFINEYCLYQILEGNGPIEVDFKSYMNWQDKIIYLSKGQYIKFLSDGFVVRKIVFKDESVFRNKDIRVLFKHLISLGYINFDECNDCQKYLSSTVFSDNLDNIIDVSSKQWYWQNPFQAQRDEYHVIFDVKDIIDLEYKNNLTNTELSTLIKDNGYKAQALVKNKIGLSIKKLLNNKRLLESKKELAFTDKSIKEVSYDLGYNDVAYFNRLFKMNTGKNPTEFRTNFGAEQRNTFTRNIIELLKEHHQQEHSLEFYANKMHLSVKTLSKKVRDKMNVSLGQLIRFEIIQSAKQLLNDNAAIHEVAIQLGFEEPNHFSAFFKRYTNTTPTEFINKKYKS